MPAKSSPGSPMPPADPFIGPFLQNPSPRGMTVAWIRHDPAECVLTYGIEGAAPGGPQLPREIHARPRWPIADTGDYFYQVDLTDLLPDTRYVYSLAGSDRSLSLGWNSHFHTFPERSDRVTFIYYGDNKTGTETHRWIASHFDRHHPAFILHSGDMTATGAYAEYQPCFFEPLRGVIDHIPLLPGRGNHEGDGKAYRQVFALPRGETWYSFDCGPAHFIVLDSTGWRHEWEQADIGRMRQWCQADLSQSQAVWKIAMYHEPSYDLGWRKDDWGRRDFLPLMRTGGIDVTLTGHAHGYQRLRPMATPGQNEGHPITHVTSAGAGAELGNKLLDRSEFLAADARRFNYTVFTIEGEQLRARVFSEQDEPLDEFELRKQNGQYDPAILAQTLSEDEYPVGRS